MTPRDIKRKIDKKKDFQTRTSGERQTRARPLGQIIFYFRFVISNDVTSKYHTLRARAYIMLMYTISSS